MQPNYVGIRAHIQSTGSGTSRDVLPGECLEIDAIPTDCQQLIFSLDTEGNVGVGRRGGDVRRGVRLQQGEAGGLSEDWHMSRAEDCAVGVHAPAGVKSKNIIQILYTQVVPNFLHFAFQFSENIVDRSSS